MRNKRTVLSTLAFLILTISSACTADDTTFEANRSPIESGCDLPREQMLLTKRGHSPNRSPDITMIPRHPHYFGDFSWTSHSGPWQYLQEVPLVLYGPGWISDRGSITVEREVTVADIAPTLAEVMDAPFPANRPGEVIEEALDTKARSGDVPDLVVVVVWDGGGTNVLERWPQAWPTLEAMAEDGVMVSGATVGSSPSITPAIHATIGTGTFPESHGIVEIQQRFRGEIRDPYEDLTPDNLRVKALAEIHDEANGNLPQIAMFGERGWLLGMIGQGAFRETGDRDIATLVEHGKLVTNDQWYELPGYLDSVPSIDRDIRRVDALDGSQDDAWMGHPLEKTLDINYSPVWSLYQNRIIEAMVAQEDLGSGADTDMLFVNYKSIDHVGHRYNMVSPEMETTIEVTDSGLRDLTSILDREVGEGQWVMAVTADHGQTPDEETTGAWPILLSELERDIAEHFDLEADRLFLAERPLSLWVDRDYLAETEVSERDIASFILGYTIGENRSEIPDAYKDRRDELLFSAAFPSEDIPRIWDCVKEKGASQD